VKVSEVSRKLSLWCLIVCSCAMFICVEISNMVQSFTHAVRIYRGHEIVKSFCVDMTNDTHVT